MCCHTTWCHHPGVAPQPLGQAGFAHMRTLRSSWGRGHLGYCTLPFPSPSLLASEPLRRQSGRGAGYQGRPETRTRLPSPALLFRAPACCQEEKPHLVQCWTFLLLTYEASQSQGASIGPQNTQASGLEALPSLSGLWHRVQEGVLARTWVSVFVKEVNSLRP